MELNVGGSRKLGLPDDGSVGTNRNPGLIERDLNGLHDRIRGTYVAARQAVHGDLARLHARPETHTKPQCRAPVDPARDGDLHADRPAARRSRGGRDATQGHLRAIVAIARRRGTDLQALLRTESGAGRPDESTLAQASAPIDLLRDGDDGQGDRDVRRQAVPAR